MKLLTLEGKDRKIHLFFFGSFMAFMVKNSFYLSQVTENETKFHGYSYGYC